MSQIKHNLFNVIESFNTLDHKSLLKYIAQQEPSKLLEAANAVQSIFVVPTKVEISEILDLILANNPIAAIKLVRNSYGCTLREAKDAVDLFRDQTTYYEPSIVSLTILKHLKESNKSKTNNKEYVYIVSNTQCSYIYGVYSDRYKADKKANELNKESDSFNYYSTQQTVE